MSFEQRWMIEGRLTTATPLRIGNGEITQYEGLRKPKEEGQTEGEKIDISALVMRKTDEDKGEPYIPGSTIKGVLRAFARSCNLPSIENLFGSENTKSPKSVGGKAEFWNAPAVAKSEFAKPPPYWRDGRCTAVATSVCIDRRTRTASDKRLMHKEFIPPGVSFNVTVCGDMNKAEVDDLLFVFEGFNHPTRQIKMGASTGDGWGEVVWELTGIRCLQAADVRDWVAGGGVAVGYAALMPLPAEDIEGFRKRAQYRATAPTKFAGALLSLQVRLNFQSHFLVNDPSQTGDAKDDKPQHAPLAGSDGRILLPASSIRGAFRSQAERILRTMGGEQAACYHGDAGPRPQCEAIYKIDELQKLCLACRLFGAPGWVAPIQFSDFVPEHANGGCELVNQEFVAIDRFTGGSAEKQKFSAKAAYRPVLTGQIKVDLAALELAGAELWGLALLALTMRDLIEGDIRLGFGAAKGYGALHAQIVNIGLPDWEVCPKAIKKWILPDQWKEIAKGLPAPGSFAEIMGYWLIELGEVAKAKGVM